jgi:hypothetical protein
MLLLTMLYCWCSCALAGSVGGGDGAVDLHVLLGKLQAELSKVQAEAAESHQANLTLAADLAVLERKQKNQVRAARLLLVRSLRYSIIKQLLR